MHEALAALAALAERLCGQQVDAIEQVGGGGNSQVYRLQARDGQRFALKRYPLPTPEDPRDRLGIEFGALRLLRKHGFEAVPRAIGADRVQGLGLYEWLDGRPVGPVGEADIDAAAVFVARLRELGGFPDADAMTAASEACLSGGELVRQIEWRLRRLKALNKESELQPFLMQEVEPRLRQQLRRLEAGRDGEGWVLDESLDPRWRTLNPSDFGFHNGLRMTDGSLRFLDFEYFGWDDPVKLVADFLWHPGMNLDQWQQRRFLVAMERIFGVDPRWRKRLMAYYPLYGLRWSLIVLNVFIPAIWRRRLKAGGGNGPGWTQVKHRQLKKAQAILARLGEDDGVIDKRL